MVTSLKMMSSFKTFSGLAVFLSFTILFTISSKVYAQETATAVVTEVENPIPNQTDGKTIYSQRVLLTINSGTFKNTKEETVYTFPTKSMGRALKIGDQVVIEVDPSNISQRVTITDFNRSRYLFLIPIVFGVATIFLFGRSKQEDLLVLGSVFLIPLLTILAVKYLHWSPIVSFTISASLLSAFIFFLKFKRQITFSSALASFIVSILISSTTAYILIETLDIWSGLLSPYLLIDNPSLQEVSKLTDITFIMLLTFIWAPTVITVYTATTTLIQLYTQEQVTSRSELVRKNISRASLLVKNAVFVPLSIATGIGIALILSTPQQQTLSKTFDNEIFAFLGAIIFLPVFSIAISIAITSFFCAILFPMSTPHRLISDKEVTKLIPPQDIALMKQSKKQKDSSEEKSPFDKPNRK